MLSPALGFFEDVATLAATTAAAPDGQLLFWAAVGGHLRRLRSFNMCMAVAVGLHHPAALARWPAASASASAAERRVLEELRLLATPDGGFRAAALAVAEVRGGHSAMIV